MEIQMLNGFSRVDVDPMDGFSRVDVDPMDGFERVTLNSDYSLNDYGLTEDEAELFARDFLAGDPVAINGLKDWIARRRQHKAEKRAQRSRRKEARTTKKENRAANVGKGGGLMSTLKDVAGKIFDRGGNDAGAMVEDAAGSDAEQKLFGLTKKSWWDKQSTGVKAAIIGGSVLAVAGGTYIIAKGGKKKRRRR